MSDFLFGALFVLILVVGLLVLPMTISRLWYRAHPRKVRFSAEAAEWAASHFPVELHPLAAIVADLLCEHMGVTLAQLEPQTCFVQDLRMDDLEPVEFLMALEEELSLEIPEQDAERLQNVAEVVRYLHQHLPLGFQAVGRQRLESR